MTTGGAHTVGGTGVGSDGGGAALGAATTASVPDGAEDEPPAASVAVTTTRTNDPAAPAGTASVAAVSFAMSVHVNAASQNCHWYA